MLDVSTMTIWRRVKAGQIEAVNLGRRTVRFRPSEVERLIAAGRAK
jgi:excisionase family DNA binding protein